jgi:hypothetical protein
MLYDPCPLNDPGDPTCDMSPWEKYSGGAQNFNYRQLKSLLDDGWEDPVSELRRLQMENRSRRRPLPVAHRRSMLSAKPGGIDWRDHMVFFEGDERESFYAGQTGRMCDPTAAIFDPSCRVSRRTHREVAYRCALFQVQP